MTFRAKLVYLENHASLNALKWQISGSVGRFRFTDFCLMAASSSRFDTRALLWMGVGFATFKHWAFLPQVARSV